MVDSSNAFISTVKNGKTVQYPRIIWVARRLAYLRAQAEENEDNPELCGRLWWHEETSNDYPDLESGLPLGEQSEWFQEFYRALTEEAELSRRMEAEEDTAS